MYPESTNRQIDRMLCTSNHSILRYIGRGDDGWMGVWIDRYMGT